MSFLTQNEGIIDLKARILGDQEVGHDAKKTTDFNWARDDKPRHEASQAVLGEVVSLCELSDQH